MGCANVLWPWPWGSPGRAESSQPQSLLPAGCCSTMLLYNWAVWQAGIQAGQAGWTPRAGRTRGLSTVMSFGEPHQAEGLGTPMPRTPPVAAAAPRALHPGTGLLPLALLPRRGKRGFARLRGCLMKCSSFIK